MSVLEKHYLSNGLKLTYAQSGDKGPVLIFLHNGAGMWQSWQKQIAHFSKSHRVYALDWPGCGASEYPVGGLNMSIIEQALEDFIEYRQLQNIHLVGNCIGAAAALNYAVKKPANVRKLILVNMCPGDLVFPKVISKNLVIRLSKNKKAKAWARLLVDAVYNKMVIRSMFPKNLFGKKMNRADPFYQLYKSRLFMPKQAQSRTALFFNAHTYNLKPIIENREVPEHLLIWGGENAILPLNTLGMLHYKMLHSNELQVVEGGGHLCMYEKPEQVNAIIGNYLNS